MGSGYGDNYTGTIGSSQPYAPQYHVVKDMHEHDVKTGVYNGSYEKNPTAKNLLT